MNFTKYIIWILEISVGDILIELIVLIGALIVSLIIVIKSADVFVDNLVEIGGH